MGQGRTDVYRAFRQDNGLRENFGGEVNHFDNIKRSEAAILFGLVLSLAIVSRLFIYSFRHIPLTNVTGGEEPLYALVGGVALAFSVPTLPLLVLYLSIFFASERASLEPNTSHRPGLLAAVLFLFGFCVAFIITISGVPSSVAKQIYEQKWIVNLVGGFLVAIYGVKVFIESGLIENLRFIRVPKGGIGILIAPPILGFVAGLLLFHHLDPPYDSVFFLTGRAGAFSHHPLSVGSFGLGLSVMYFALAYGFSLLIYSRLGARVLTWINGLSVFLLQPWVYRLPPARFHRW